MKNGISLALIICLMALISLFNTAGECAVQCVGMPSDISQWQQCKSAQDCVVTKDDCGKFITFNAIFLKEETQYALCKPPDTTCKGSSNDQNVKDVKADCVKNKCVMPHD